MPISITAFCKSDPGICRPHNEDTCLVCETQGYFLVADGIGGAAAGEIASALFTEAVQEVFLASSPRRSAEENITNIKQSFLAANKKILSHVGDNPAHRGMGCTAEILAITNGGFALGHIGDSRTYRLRDRILTQMTSDHSLVQQQIDLGLISRQEARNHPKKNIILRAVGMEHKLAVDILQGQLLPGDCFLLCSDGLTDMLDDDAIQRILIQDASLRDKVDILIHEANRAGGRDNISVVLVEAL